MRGDVVDRAGRSLPPADLGARPVAVRPEVAVDRPVTVGVIPPARPGDGDRRGELSLDPPPLQLERTEPLVELGIVRHDELFDDVFQHMPILANKCTMYNL